MIAAPRGRCAAAVVLPDVSNAYAARACIMPAPHATLHGVVFRFFCLAGEPDRRRLDRPALRPADDHAVPAQAPIRLVAGRRMECDQRARAVLIEAGALAVERELYALAQNALAIRGGDDAKIGVDQQHARLVAVADAH